MELQTHIMTQLDPLGSVPTIGKSKNSNKKSLISKTSSDLVPIKLEEPKLTKKAQNTWLQKTN